MKLQPDESFAGLHLATFKTVFIMAAFVSYSVYATGFRNKAKAPENRLSKNFFCFFKKECDMGKCINSPHAVLYM